MSLHPASGGTRAERPGGNGVGLGDDTEVVVGDEPQCWQRASLVGNKQLRTKVWAPESMSRRGPRLIIDGEGRRSHGGPLALSARITRRFQQASPLAKNLDFQPIPLPFPGT